MKSQRLIPFLALGLATSLLLVLLGFGEDAEELNEAQVMELWRKYNTPNEHHRKLEIYVGEWKVETKFWMDGIDKPPTVSKGTLTSRLIYGGRFLETEMNCIMLLKLGEVIMEIPIQGRGFTGYDTFKKKYTSSWIDSNSTSMWVAEGFLDKSGKVFTYYGTMDEWLTGEHDKPVKFIDRIINQDTVVSEIHDMSLEPDKTLVMRMVSTRISDEVTSRPSGGGGAPSN